MDENKIVISYPSFDKMGLESDLFKDLEVISLEETLITLIKEATSEILISSPFLEPDTIKGIINILIKKAYDGVNVKILIREINNRKESILKLIDEIDSNNLNKKFEIKEYHYYKENKVFSSIHAKFLISDKKLAYVGSGELRYNSFKKNLEIGLIAKGDKVITLRKIFYNLWEVSKEIK
ncbi:MAG: phospholipase D family protein [Nanoarchaeota archaeon]|nr:phospholipase D family protein [Nanoarchaeota archaeon]